MGYQDQNLALNKSIYLATRNVVISLTERYYIAHGSNQFTHSIAGRRTVKEEIDKQGCLAIPHRLKYIETAWKEV